MITFAIGDIHGCADQLASVITRCVKMSHGQPARWVFLGDYIDRGPASAKVVKMLMELEADDPEVICLKGNHEQMLLWSVADAGTSDLWLRNGGQRTLDSYGVKSALGLPHQHLAWLSERPLFLDDGQRFFVHAGVATVPPEKSGEEAMLWIREPFLSDRITNYGRLVVHGHTPISAGLPQLFSNRLNLDTGCVFGGHLTAAVFDAGQIEPIAFINEEGIL